MLIDKVIAALSPSWAATRAANRFRLERITEATREYEGASSGRRTQNWKSQSKDANAELLPALNVLRNRSRDLRRNNPYAVSAVESIVDNVVGYGIRPRIKGRTKTITKNAQAMWQQHAESTAIDYDGLHNIYGIQALAIGTMVDSGGVLLRRRLLDSKSGKSMPFQVQVLEPDYIDLTRTGSNADGSFDLMGIRYEKSGGVRGYWLYETHPGQSYGYTIKVPSSFVPARDVIYMFRQDRPGQAHGVPWAAPVLLRLRNFDEVEDAYIEREKIAACFSVFFSGDDPDTSKTKMQLSERLEPGLVQFLPPGTTASFASPPGVNGYRDFSDLNLHAIAAGYGVPYEELTGNLAGVNFSSGRMGYQRYGRRVERWQWQTVIPTMCLGVWSWFDSSCQVLGVYNESCAADWIPPRRMMVNPKEEVAAMKDEVRSGFATWSQQVQGLGYDPDEQAAAIAEDNQRFDDNGLKLDCDPRFALPAGSAGATNGGDTGGSTDTSGAAA